MFITTITSKGQATIPSTIRKKLGLKAGAKIGFEEKNKEFVLKAVASPEEIVDSLYGSLKTNIKWNKRQAREAVGKMLAEKYIQTLK